MAFYDPITERLQFMRNLSPTNLKRLADEKLSDIVLKEVGRSRTRVDDLTQRYPSAGPRELAQRLIDGKKGLASMVGGVSGVFGVITVPADLMVMAWLQIILLVDLGTLYKANLKSPRARKELLDLFGYANGIGPMQRASPKVLGKLVTVILDKGGMAVIGRTIPLIAAPISAYLNNLHIQQIGDEAIRHFDGFDKVHVKASARKAARGE